jgi:capsular polysaccharide biosynthesis protein/Mrp family chromosome partitioning ATPase
VDHVSRTDSPAVADYTGALRRRWWIALAVTVLCLIGAVGYIEAAPKAYASTATVYVSPTAEDIASQASSASKTGVVNLYTEAQEVTSGVVAALAGKSLHSSLTPAQLVKQIAVAIPANSQTLNITCTTSTSTGSAACANAFATAYLQNRSSTAAAGIAQQIAPLQKRINSLLSTVSKEQTTVNGLPSGSSQRDAAQAQLNSNQSQLNQLNSKVAGLDGEATQTNGGNIITKALPSSSPTSPKKAIVLPAGIIVGLIAGLLGAILWDRRDKRLHSAGDVERLLGLPVLLSLPAKAWGRRVSLAPPRSRTGRAFTELAHNLAASLGEGSHIVLVAGTSPGPAVSVAAANLAATLGRTHSEAVLVCAAMRDSVGPELFGLADGLGLAEVLAGQATVSEVARGPASAPGLWVIPPGADTSLAEYSLQHDTARALTTQLRRGARFVVIEVQASGDGADTLALAEFADAAVLTIELQRTTKTQVEGCIKRLRQMRTPMLGAAVLPPVRPGVTVLPPQQDQARLGDRRAAGEVPGRGGALGRGQKSSPSGPATSSSPDRDLVRPGRPADRYEEPADRNSGS